MFSLEIHKSSRKKINVENKKSNASIQYFLGKDFNIRIYTFMIKHYQIIMPEHYIVNTLIYLFLSFFKTSANTVRVWNQF